MPSPQNPLNRILAYVIGGVWLVLTPNALIFAGLSVMASDSGVSPGVYAFIYTCWTLPIATLIASVGGFIGGARRNMRIVAFTSALPFLSVAAAIGVLVAFQARH